MTAGQGILHIERPPEQLVASGGLFHGIQLWVNLPAVDKMVPARYQDIGAERVTLLTSPDGGALVRVIAGSLGDHEGPASTHTPITMVHATIQPGAQLQLPWRTDFNALAYVLSGQGNAGPERRPVGTGQLVTFQAGDTIVLGACPEPGEPGPRPRRADPGRPPHRRAGGLVRALRDEHPAPAGPGVRRTSGPAAWASSRPTTSAD